MASGIEVAGLALALLPLFVNQIDGYVRGMEKVKMLRRPRREFKFYVTGLRSQQTILQDTLHHALRGIIDDDEKLSHLIQHPHSQDWQKPELQKKLSDKLGRHYEIFQLNIDDLSELLGRLCRKLRIDTSGSLPRVPETGFDISQLWIIMNKALLDDLLERLNNTNSILRTLVESSTQRYEASQPLEAKGPWNHLLERYRSIRQHAESLFQIIVRGDLWLCPCKEQHHVQLKLGVNPLHPPLNDAERKESDPHVRFVFSNMTDAKKAGLWMCTEVAFEPWEAESQTISAIDHYSTKTIHQSNNSPLCFDGQRKDRAQTGRAIQGFPTFPTILDFCSSLNKPNGDMGYISHQSDSLKYKMHRISTLPDNIPFKSLGEVVSTIPGLRRLYIAASLACSVIQFHGNWLRFDWDRSDFQLAARQDGNSILPDNLYLSWPISPSNSFCGTSNDSDNKINGTDRLLSLGIALVELSLGKPLSELLRLEGTAEDLGVKDRRTAFFLVQKTRGESGNEYADAVSKCFFGPDLFHGGNFEDLVFRTIVAPLLNNVAFYEGHTNFAAYQRSQ